MRGPGTDRIPALFDLLSDSSDGSTAAKQLYQHSYDRQYQQDVNEPTHGVSGHHAQHPHHDQN